VEEAEQEPSVREPIDPFKRGEGKYGGRVPYRSREDLEREAQMQQQQQHQQAAQQQQQYQQPMQAARQQPAPAQQQAYQQNSGNVVQFPGMQQSNDGSVYAHVEYVVLLRSRQECKDVIAYIKSNASVFLNMEFIASDSERQRCVDMLSGAAYTLGCALNKISPRGIYLISSPSVRVVLDSAMQKFTAAPDQQGIAQQMPAEEAQQPVGGAFTTRFQAQSGQRPPSGFGSVMAGNATGMYQPVAAAGRYQNAQQ
jgi:FtsZ-interacting cell division protein YlmF